MLANLLVATLAQVSPAPVQADQTYRCEIVRDAPSGRHQGFMLVDEAGRGFDPWVRWEQAAPINGGRFNIRWTLDPGLQVTSATVEIDVPIRKWKMGRTSLGLRRPDDDGPADMALMGPVLHGRASGGRGVAQIGLRTLLAYAADAERLRWYVLSGDSKKSLGFGDIEMAPLRDAIAALPAVRADLAARQARYRSECKPHVEEPQI